MARYDTLQQLRDAYAQGAVTAPLMLDNDATSVYQPAPDDPDDLRGEDVFGMHPADVLDQALSLLGIPHESV
jgi:hypothetical protein